MSTLLTGFLIAIPPLALILTLIFTHGDRLHVRLLRFFGILVSSIPVVGIMLGFFVREKSPNFAKACFIQAAFCGVGIILVY